MKKRYVQILFFTLVVIGLVLPLVRLVMAPAPPQNFNVSVSVANVIPRIHNISINGDDTPPFSGTPTENTSTNFSIVFNVSDSNGQGNIVDATVSAALNFTTSGRQNFTGCAVLTTGTNDKKYNCTVVLFWFDENASTTNNGYTLNVTAADADDARANNFTDAAFTYNVLTAISLSSATLRFSGSPGTNDVRESNLFNITNTGNDQFRRINITAYDLNGITQVLGVTNFTINVTNTTDGVFRGVGLANGTERSFMNDTLWISRGNGSSKALYLSINFSAGLTEVTYNASTLWVLEVDRNPV